MGSESCYRERFISYEQSMQIIDNIKIRNQQTKELFLSDALGYTIAQDIIAQENSPAYPTSAMDGYAFKFEDTKLEKLKIIDFNPAGSEINSEVTQGTCIKTFTGSLMPKGSDTLIPIENVTVDDDMIIINEPVKQGFSTREIGENYAKGEILIKKGTKIGFAQIGVIASLNISYITVYCKPTVAIASTGSEILDLGETQTNKAQIRSSNHLTLEAIAKQHGANVNQMGVVKDDKESILQLVQSSLDSSDIVVTTGGVSVGDYDFVKDIIKDKIGATILFQGVNIKPGQHIIVAQKDDKFIIGLPGFAYSSTVTFILYVLPLIFKFQGLDKQHLPVIKATIKTDFPKKSFKTVFTACNLTLENGQYFIDFNNKKSGTSAILTNMLGDVALLMQQSDSKDLSKGDLADVVLIQQ